MKATSLRLKELAAQDAALALRIDTADADRDAIRTKVSTLQASLSSTASKLNDEAQERQSVETTVTQLSNKVNTIQTTANQLASTAAQNSSAISDATQAIATMNDTVESMHKNVTNRVALKLYDTEEAFAADTERANGQLAYIRESGRTMRYHLNKIGEGTLFESYNGHNAHTFQALGKDENGNPIIAYAFRCLYRNDNNNTVFQTTADLHGGADVYEVDGVDNIVDATAWAAGTYTRKDIAAVYDKVQYVTWKTAHDTWKSQHDAYEAFQRYITDHDAWEERHYTLTQQLADAQAALTAAQKQKTDWDKANPSSTTTNPYIATVTAAQKDVDNTQAKITADVEPTEIAEAEDPGDEPVLADSACRARRRGYVFADGDTVRNGKVYNKSGAVVSDIDSTLVIPQEEARYLYEVVRENNVRYSYNNTATGSTVDRVYVIPQDSNLTTVSAGRYTSVAADNTIAVGYKAAPSAANSIAFGANAKADAANSIAIGADSTTGTSNDPVVSFGNDTTKRRLINIADATGDHDAVSLAQANTLDAAVTASLNSKIESLKTELTKSVSDATSSLTSKIESNTTAITNETTARTKANTDLTNKINANTTAISDETTNRTKAITDLTSKVTANTTAISDEAKARAVQDTAIQSSISTLQSTLEKKITDSVAAAKTEIESDIDSKVAAAKSELETEMNAAIKKAIDDYKASVASSSGSNTTNP